MCTLKGNSDNEECWDNFASSIDRPGHEVAPLNYK